MVVAHMNRNLWVVCWQSLFLCVITFCRKIPSIVLSLAIVKQILSKASFMTLPFLMMAAGGFGKVLVRWSGLMWSFVSSSICIYQ